MAHAMLVGNPADGFDVMGPYFSHEDALAAGDTVTSDWWVVEMQPPDTPDTDLWNALCAVQETAAGDSNDAEISALQDALSMALAILGQEMPGEAD